MAVLEGVPRVWLPPCEAEGALSCRLLAAVSALAFSSLRCASPAEGRCPSRMAASPASSSATCGPALPLQKAIL